MSKDTAELKKKLCDAVDAAADEIAAYVKDIGEHAELGFFETRTSERLAKELEKCGLKVKRGIARTGLRTDIASDKPGPKIAILGELDGITCRAHPNADPVTGASHACGHHLQTASVIAAAIALTKTGVMQDLCGSVALMGVPAEEVIDIERREELIKKGEIAYLCGKPEFVRLGEFDNVDISLICHAGDNAPEASFTVPDGGNGFRMFSVQYQGRQAHAAAAPHKGINALYAAVSGINSVNALRETFIDTDRVRVHYIITKGGDAANSIPDDVRLEGYVRGRTSESIDMNFAKVQRAFESGATALGAGCLFKSMPGDLPLMVAPELNKLFANNAVALVGEKNVMCGTYFAASTDMGDLTHIMPAIHPSAGGVFGALHSAEFKITDFAAAALAPAKAMLMTIVDLLADNAQCAREIIANFKPVYTKEQYLASQDARFFEHQTGVKPA